MSWFQEYKSIFIAYGVLFLAFSIQACGRQMVPEEPCNFVQNSQKQRVSWGHFAPAKLYIHESVSNKYHQAIFNAAEKWNSLAGKQVLYVYPGVVGGPRKVAKDSRNVIYMMNEWEVDKTNEQARTKVRWRGERIIEADISINNVNFEFSALESAPPTEVDLESLMIHEFGHVLGLAHIDDNYSVMNSKLRKGVERLLFAQNNIEYNSLSCEY